MLIEAFGEAQILQARDWVDKHSAMAEVFRISYPLSVQENGRDQLYIAAQACPAMAEWSFGRTAFQQLSIKSWFDGALNVVPRLPFCAINIRFDVSISACDTEIGSLWLVEDGKKEKQYAIRIWAAEIKIPYHIHYLGRIEMGDKCMVDLPMASRKRLPLLQFAKNFVFAFNQMRDRASRPKSAVAAFSRPDKAPGQQGRFNSANRSSTKPRNPRAYPRVCTLRLEDLFSNNRVRPFDSWDMGGAQNPKASHWVTAHWVKKWVLEPECDETIYDQKPSIGDPTRTLYLVRRFREAHPRGAHSPGGALRRVEKK